MPLRIWALRPLVPVAALLSDHDWRTTMKHFGKMSGFRLSFIVAAFAAAFCLTPANAASVKTAAVSGLSYTFQTAPTQFIDVGGTRLAYRRFGKRGGVPLVFFQHFV